MKRINCQLAKWVLLSDSQTRKPTLAPLLLALLAASLLAACSGISGSSGNSNPVPIAQNAAACASSGIWGSNSARSSWVYPASDNVLVYKNLNAQGDHIMDFSSAGYMGGGVAFPAPPATITISPVGGGGDDTSSIQSAIDKVSAMTPGSNGIRGVVLLKAGKYSVGNTLHITTSGVILRGSGSGDASGVNGTVITDTNTSQTITNSDPNYLADITGHLAQVLLNVQGTGSYTINNASTVTITDNYVPSGKTAFTVNDASGFQVGNSIVVQRPVTDVWLTFMHMHPSDVGAGDAGSAGNKWLDVGSSGKWLRKITAIDGNRITVDIPLSDSFDSTYTTGKVSLYTQGNPISQVGIEHLRMVGMPRTRTVNNTMLYLENIVDSWVDDVVGDNFTWGVFADYHALRSTIRSVALTHENSTVDPPPCLGSKFMDFSISGGQILVDKSSSTGAAGSFYLVTQTLTPGPNVALNFHGEPDAVCQNGVIYPHQRWATGLLVDGAQLALNKNTAGVAFVNRGSAGTGHGWSMGWGVVWNSVADLNLQAPPGTTNWGIGYTGKVIPTTSPAEPDGIYDASNPVTPKSLYLAQLCQRLGVSAVHNIGY